MAFEFPNVTEPSEEDEGKDSSKDVQSSAVDELKIQTGLQTFEN